MKGESGKLMEVEYSKCLDGLAGDAGSMGLCGFCIAGVVGCVILLADLTWRAGCTKLPCREGKGVEVISRVMRRWIYRLGVVFCETLTPLFPPWDR